MRAGGYLGVSSFTDKLGRVRYRFRRKGYQPHMMQAEFGTPEFDAEYRDCQLRSGRSPRYRKAPSWRNRAPAEEKDGFIYFIEHPDGPIKIGFSKDPQRRLRAIDKHHPKPLKLIAAIPGTTTSEFHIHKRWEHLRIRGEWFYGVPGLVEEIRRLVANQNGKPARMEKEMADFRASQEGSGSPSWVTTNEDFCGLGDGKLAEMTHGNPPSPVSDGKLEIGADLARRARP